MYNQTRDEKRDFKSPQLETYRYSENQQRMHDGRAEHLLKQEPSLYRNPDGRLSVPHNQPDYTQVSPAKLALRRHLSQEKLSHNTSTSVRTIGDLVNGEIERTLEISKQSIINAAVNGKIIIPSQ